MLVCALDDSCVYDYEPKDARVQGLGKPLAEDSAVLPLGANVWVESQSGEIIPGLPVETDTNTFLKCTDCAHTPTAPDPISGLWNE